MTDRISIPADLSAAIDDFAAKSHVTRDEAIVILLQAGLDLAGAVNRSQERITELLGGDRS